MQYESDILAPLKDDFSDSILLAILLRLVKGLRYTASRQKFELESTQFWRILFID